MNSPMGGVAACWGFYIVASETETALQITRRSKKVEECPKDLGIVHRPCKGGVIKKAGRGTDVKA
jgi:hypothetical protein